jgi:hypothetical protein
LVSVSDMVTGVEHPHGLAKIDKGVDQIRHSRSASSLALEGKLEDISVISAIL